MRVLFRAPIRLAVLQQFKILQVHPTDVLEEICHGRRRLMHSMVRLNDAEALVCRGKIVADLAAAKAHVTTTTTTFLLVSCKMLL